MHVSSTHTDGCDHPMHALRVYLACLKCVVDNTSSYAACSVWCLRTAAHAVHLHVSVSLYWVSVVILLLSYWPRFHMNAVSLNSSLSLLCVFFIFLLTSYILIINNNITHSYQWYITIFELLFVVQMISCSFQWLWITLGWFGRIVSDRLLSAF